MNKKYDDVDNNEELNHILTKDEVGSDEDSNDMNTQMCDTNRESKSHFAPNRQEPDHINDNSSINCKEVSAKDYIQIATSEMTCNKNSKMN